MQPEPFGDAAWRFPRPDGISAPALLAALRAWPGVIDVVVAEAHVLVTFDPDRPPADPTPALARASALATSPRDHRVRVRYDGADLADVARATGLSIDAVIAAHAREYEVRMIGFRPGFAYLGPLADALVLPRRNEPRARVPPLSVAVAGPYTGIYPAVSPGGWHLLGTAVDFVPFTPETGAALALGDRVRFEPC